MDIRPFTFAVPEEQLVDMRRRVAATQWPDQEVDPTQGVQLEVIQALARYGLGVTGATSTRSHDGWD